MATEAIPPRACAKLVLPAADHPPPTREEGTA
ncbi:hypothetical protein ABID70_002413 [Clavibacter michiganensis]|nr:hypothetical protein [Clavibacter michiganensis]MDQ0409459.1 hypothetical protein [Clavibacter michiganensis]